MSDEIIIDGSAGEGGGQILRTALTLSLVTGRPFRVVQIRAGRPRPGLLRQHLTAVQAAGEIGRARVDGAVLGSRELRFAPSGIEAGTYEFAIGTAGSTLLVLQTVLPALLRAAGPSRVVVDGGTHNTAAPPFEFIARTFLPLLRQMGARVRLTLDAHGFYPAGGGRVTADIEPCEGLTPLHLLDRGPAQVTARVLLASLPEKIGKIELGIVRERLGLSRDACRIDSIADTVSPGNVLQIFIESDTVCEVVTGFGEKGITAATVASEAAKEASELLAADVPVGTHLADQLLVPMAMAGGGAVRTLTPTPHTETNIAVITRFLDVRIGRVEERPGVFRLDVEKRTSVSGPSAPAREVSYEQP